LEGKSVQIEKSLQTIIERNLEAFLGVRFLETEYGTGPKHGGRIDTLGIDENNCPVIIEYKRATNENIINQGLFYIDWLLDHKAEFELLVQKKLGKNVSENIEWGGTRLICIAGDYTKYDNYAVEQIDRNIELIRYKKFADLIMFELVNTVSGESVSEEKTKKKIKYSTVSELLSKSSPQLKDLFELLKSFVLNLGDDVQIKELKFYYAFKKIRNFISLEIHPQNNTLVLYLSLDPKTIRLEKDFTRDVKSIGHLGTGDLEVKIRSIEDFERAKPFIFKSYESS
ncbi:MAG: DUF91 domain-containing protein, partial [Ignavibacteria bacterium RBG_13_36_8]